MLLVCLNLQRRPVRAGSANAGKILPFLTHDVDGDSHAVAFTPDAACKCGGEWGQYVPSDVAIAAGYELAPFNKDAELSSSSGSVVIRVQGSVDADVMQRIGSAVSHELRAL